MRSTFPVPLTKQYADWPYKLLDFVYRLLMWNVIGLCHSMVWQVHSRSRKILMHWPSKTLLSVEGRVDYVFYSWPCLSCISSPWVIFSVFIYVCVWSRKSFQHALSGIPTKAALLKACIIITGLTSYNNQGISKAVLGSMDKSKYDLMVSFFFLSPTVAVVEDDLLLARCLC